MIATRRVCELSPAAKVKGGRRNARAERRQKEGSEVICKKKGLKCRRKEQLKVGISQARESLVGKARGPVCGWCLLTTGSLINSGGSSASWSPGQLSGLPRCTAPFRPQEAPFIPTPPKWTERWSRRVNVILTRSSGRMPIQRSGLLWGSAESLWCVFSQRLAKTQFWGFFFP